MLLELWEVRQFNSSSVCRMAYSARRVILGKIGPCLANEITLKQIRQSGHPLLRVICSDRKCMHSTVIDADCWPGYIQLSDLERLFVCPACGHRGADVRPSVDIANASKQ